MADSFIIQNHKVKVGLFLQQKCPNFLMIILISFFYKNSNDETDTAKQTSINSLVVMQQILEGVPIWQVSNNVEPRINIQ